MQMMNTAYLSHGLAKALHLYRTENDDLAPYYILTN